MTKKDLLDYTQHGVLVKVFDNLLDDYNDWEFIYLEEALKIMQRYDWNNHFKTPQDAIAFLSKNDPLLTDTINMYIESRMVHACDLNSIDMANLLFWKKCIAKIHEIYEIHENYYF